LKLLVTETLKVTSSSRCDGLLLDVSEAEVPAFTTSWSALPELGEKSLEPAYRAVNVFPPAVAGATLHWPPGAEAVQLTEPSLTVTVPEGVPPLEVTWKTTTIDWVGNDGDGSAEVICVVVRLGPLFTGDAVPWNVALMASDPTTLASTPCAPVAEPNVQRALARPSESVVAVSGLVLPPPAVTTKATRIWGAGRPAPSVARTTKGLGSGCPLAAV
jgi:hypothetical protein